jgi:triphosphoribosyl-dephospho-CoA synthase
VTAAERERAAAPSPLWGRAADVAAAAQLACLLEASAPKPGNVSPGRHFSDMRYEDFLASAAAIGGPLTAAAGRPLGATIRLAIEATARWTRANTNLGIVLLLAPLARAAVTVGSDPGDGASWGLTPGPDEPGVGGGGEGDSSWQKLRTRLRQVLDETTVEDARDVYEAIRLASPGGLGTADSQDVAGDPTVTLVDAMRLAAHRDGIAREYATAFELTFETGAPAVARARRDGLPWDDAIVETFLAVLANTVDTHVVRRGGASLAADVSRLAHDAIAAGGVRSESGRRAIAAMDARLRDPRNVANPGTAADLTAAAIFVVLLAGGWQH